MLLPIAAVPSSKTDFYYIVAMLMNNTANTLSANETELVWPWEDDIDDAIVLIVLYYIMGILAILANGLLLYSLCKQRKHRHNLPLVGFIIGSATYGISYIYTAMYRTYVIVSKPDGTIILVCMAYMPFFTIGNRLGCLSLLVQRRTRWLTTFVILVLTFGDVLLSWLVVADVLYTVASPFCFTEEFMPTSYFDFHLFFNFSI
ncbi:hypothetical protein M513_04107, partial [Trichuris suis]